MSLDGEWEVQHLSLPWGWNCEDSEAISIVQAFVPAECFRYESQPKLSPNLAERLRGIESEYNYDAVENDPIYEMQDSPDLAAANAYLAEQCRNEVHITENSTSWTCGARCGTDEYNGYALYPNRFFVNITSHIEWYKSRGVSEYFLDCQLMVAYDALLAELSRMSYKLNVVKG